MSWEDLSGELAELFDGLSSRHVEQLDALIRRSAHRLSVHALRQRARYWEDPQAARERNRRARAQDPDFWRERQREYNRLYRERAGDALRAKNAARMREKYRTDPRMHDDAYRAKRRAYQRRRQVSGRCVNCGGGPLATVWRCTGCSWKHNANARTRKGERP